MSTSTSYPGRLAPSSMLQPTAFLDIIRTLVSQLNSQQWTISGAALNLGGGIFRLPDTFFVNHSQTVGPETMTSFLDYPGNTFEISDSTVPAWTGTVSNVGQVITAGGGSNRVRVKFNEQYGYVIAG